MEEQKSRFFTNVSHEIRTPLTLMLSPLESYLQGDYGKDVGREFLRQSLPERDPPAEAYQQSSRFFQDRVRENDHERRPGRHQNVFCRTTRLALDSACESRGISFRLKRGHIENIHADAEKLDRIFMNLFSNALKFTGRGGAIKVRMEDDDDFCRIDFEDNGVGVPAGQA